MKDETQQQSAQDPRRPTSLIEDTMAVGEVAKVARVQIRRTHRNSCPVATSLAHTHLHQSDTRNSVRIGYLP
jgi:hypothetical protein